MAAVAAPPEYHVHLLQNRAGGPRKAAPARAFHQIRTLLKRGRIRQSIEPAQAQAKDWPPCPSPPHRERPPKRQQRR